MTSPDEQDKKIAHRIRTTPDRQLVNFIELSIEVMQNGSFPISCIGKLNRVCETLKRFKQGHEVSS